MLPLTKTLTVTSTLSDGFANWDNRTNAPGVDMNGTSIAQVGGHRNTSVQFCNAFVFRFGDGTPGSGIPQGRTITNAQLNLHAGNGNTIGLDYLWIGVENNLDPTKLGRTMSGGDPDQIADGTQASNIWQRLTAQSPSVTAFGRSGVTHDPTIGTLTGRFTNPRQQDALIYLAFAAQSGQPTRSWTANQYNLTNNFAPALQALVNDTSWNPDDQRVLVFMWVANQDAIGGAPQGAVFGNGNLGALTYNNGQDGPNADVDATNSLAGGQLHFSGAGVGFTPQLTLTHRSSTPNEPLIMDGLSTAAGGSTMSGRALLAGREAVVRWRGRRFVNTNYGALVPKISTGADDTPLWDMTAQNPSTAAWVFANGNPIGSRVKWAADTHYPSGANITLEGYALPAQASNVTFNVNYWPSQINWDLEAYSMRFYYQIEGTSPPTIPWYVVSFFTQDDTLVWDIQRRGNDLDSFSRSGEVRTTVYGSPGTTIMNDYIPVVQVEPFPGVWRWELQVDNRRNPKMQLRVYQGRDTTTATHNWTANPTQSLAMSKFRFGSPAPGLQPIQHYGDIELHPNYSLSGEFQDPVTSDVGHPFVPQKWAWFEWDGTQAKPLVDLGTITSYNPGTPSVPVIDATQALTYETDTREIVNLLSYTKLSAENYVSGSSLCTLDRYKPNFVAQPQGRPCFIYVHGGFFIAGDKDSSDPSGVPLPLVDLLTSMGWEVVSINYPLSSAVLPDTNPYPTFSLNSNGGGLHPSHVVAAKLAARYMAAKTGEIDPNNIVIGGFSAGGYIALAAAYSRGLTNDGYGRNLTVTNTTFGGTAGTYGSSAATTDPVFKGALSLHGPVNLTVAAAYDPTVPKWEYNNVDGTIRCTCKSFMGRTLASSDYSTDGSALDYLLTFNTAVTPPPTYYSEGGSDYLVHWEHWPLLRDALAARGVPVTHEFNRATTHDNAVREYDPTRIVNWLNSIVPPPS